MKPEQFGAFLQNDGGINRSQLRKSIGMADLFGNCPALFDDFNLDGGLAEKLRPENS